METRTVEQVESWQTRRFTDGFAGLRELSDGEFSGAIEAGGAWLFMLNGRVIGVCEGSLDDFEDADGTAYAAPHPSLPLLFSMQERGGQTQAKYYTKKKSLSEVDSTLSQGSFTGYVELSENVLSGDYYVAYYGGRSMSVAFVGASENVLTGEEAFERADDEVGIYEVRDVDIEVVDVPEPDEPDDADESDEPSATGDSAPSADPPSSDDRPSGGATTDGRSAANRPSTDESAAGESATEQSSTGQSATGSPATGQSTPDSSVTNPSATGPSATDSAATDSSAPGRSSAGQSATDRSSAGPPTGDASASDPAEQSAASAGASDDSKAAEASDRASTPETPADPSAGTNSTAGTSSPAETGSTTSPTAEARSAGTTTTGSQSSGSQSASSAARPEESAATDAPSEREPESGAASEESAGGDVFDEEDEWRETTTIPSLDPDRSEDRGGATDGESAASETGRSESTADDRAGSASAGQSNSAHSGGRSPQASGPKGDASASASRAGSGRTGASGGTGTSDGASASGGTSASGGAGEAGGADESEGASEEVRSRLRKLRTRLDQREEQVERLKDRLSTLESERNEYKRERDALRQEVERLEAKLESGGSSGGDGGRRLDRSQAFDGTNLFVRYQSKGKATLAEASEGTADPEDVNANLRLEHHTQFEADDVTVAGDSFEEFLTDSFEYQFVSWVVEHLLYEIRDTGHHDRLRDLYDAIPRIDRVDLHGSVDAGSDDGDTRRESFDVVMRDKMGNPLVVADLNDSRDPTTGEMMGSLVDASTGIARTYDELAGAFQVTESFFEPAALETAESATSGGFLSREKRESFVKLSRKRGYHLCLVESRSGGFHLNVPEL